jgi:hypothetical protein
MYILTSTATTLVIRFLNHSDGFLGDSSAIKQKRVSSNFYMHARTAKSRDC